MTQNNQDDSAAEFGSPDDNNASEENKDEGDDGIDPMMKYLSNISEERSSKENRNHIVEVFKDFSDDPVKGGYLS